ncbi:MAG TPA: GNAT family N-acetyltransferase [Solirubrobacteraceae bacterium]|nr:GNAT family N-acetyltransferase [Solirubrobacteraceae bacterium]
MIGTRPQTPTPPVTGSLAEQWNALALGGGTPFMTYEWLDAWEAAFGDGACERIMLRDAQGGLRACTCIVRAGRGRLASTTNSHSPDWELLAADDASRRELARALITKGAARVQLQGMLQDGPGAAALVDELAAGGYRTVREPGPFCPWLSLPGTWEELSAAISGSLRSQVRRRRKMLEREGELRFRVGGQGAELERDLESFLRIEASGWKGRDGTAILSRPETARLYREFAQAAAERGWLRLYFLELDGATIAADYDCAFGGTSYFMKTGFDERHARLSPGLVLRAEVLRSSIEEGLTGYDFLGEPDTYKTRWTAERRPRLALWAYRREALGGYAYRKRLRPLLKAARDRAAELRERRGGSGSESLKASSVTDKGKEPKR